MYVWEQQQHDKVGNTPVTKVNIVVHRATKQMFSLKLSFGYNLSFHSMLSCRYILPRLKKGYVCDFMSAVFETESESLF